MQPNVLMCRYVCGLLPPARQAHLRSAGSLGYDAFEELVALGDVPAYVEVVAGEGGDARLGALINAPIRGVEKPQYRKKKIPAEYVVVFWEGAMRRRDIPEPDWSRLPWTSIRYHCDPQALRGLCLPEDFKIMHRSCATFIELVCNGVEAMKSTPPGYLSYCAKLQDVDLSWFKNVSVIEDSFMVKTGVKVDLSPLSNVHTIKDSMLMNNLQAVSIDLTPLRNVTSIGHNFLACCYKLTSIDLSPFVNLETIGTGFLRECEALESIDLAPLAPSLVSIEGSLLTRCLNLKHVDLTPLKGLLVVGHGVLHGCYGLESVTLPTFDHPDAIGSNFMGDCMGLQSIDLSPLHNMTTIPPHFLNNCSGLTSIDLTPFSKVRTISRMGMAHGYPASRGHFLRGCTGIVHLDLSPMVLLSKDEKVESVADNFDDRISWGA